MQIRLSAAALAVLVMSANVGQAAAVDFSRPCNDAACFREKLDAMQQNPQAPCSEDKACVQRCAQSHSGRELDECISEWAIRNGRLIKANACRKARIC